MTLPARTTFAVASRLCSLCEPTSLHLLPDRAGECAQPALDDRRHLAGIPHRLPAVIENAGAPFDLDVELVDFRLVGLGLVLLLPQGRDVRLDLVGKAFL